MCFAKVLLNMKYKNNDPIKYCVWYLSNYSCYTCKQFSISFITHLFARVCLIWLNVWLFAEKLSDYSRWKQIHVHHYIIETFIMSEINHFITFFTMSISLGRGMVNRLQRWWWWWRRCLRVTQSVQFCSAWSRPSLLRAELVKAYGWLLEHSSVHCKNKTVQTVQGWANAPWTGEEQFPPALYPGGKAL